MVLTLIALYPALNGVYIWDDHEWLTGNDLILKPGQLGKIWFEPTASPHYYPLVFTTFWLEYRLFGGLGTVGADDNLLRGMGYHVTNLLLHMMVVWLIYAILCRLKLPGRKLGAWLSAAIFAVHPTCVETVAWISERKNCLGGVFFFASLYFGFKALGVFADQSRDRKVAHYLLALVMFVAAMLSKTTACVVGPVLLLMIWWRRGRITRRDALWTLPFFVIGLVMGGFTAHLESQHVGAAGPEFAFSALQRILIAGTDLWFYVGKLVVPYPVMQIYPRFDIVAGQPTTNVLYYLAPLAFLGLLACLFFWRRKISRGPLVAILFFAGVLAPALGFINFYTMMYTFVADHYQYYACIGVIVLVVEGVLMLLKKVGKHVPPERLLRLTILLWAGILLSLVLLTNRVAQLYTDGEALWKFNVIHNPKSYMPQACLGATRLESGHLQSAIEAFEKAIEIDPTNWQAYDKLGKIYFRLNQPELGTQYLFKSEELMPELTRNKARERTRERMRTGSEGKR